MPTPRSQLISLTDTPWYHCISRCVRRAWLCGYDEETGIDYEYRRDWIVDRLELLSRTFSIEIAAYAIMSNHHHVVLRVNADAPKEWTLRETVERWHKVYKGSFLSQRYAAGGTLSDVEMKIVRRSAAVWKERLFNISWFMKALNEPIARAANAEDNCTGRFYEGRFKSQALLDEKAVLACMVYVDLNPIRAQLAASPEESEFTSIKERISNLKKTTSTFLAPFNGDAEFEACTGVPYHLVDYIELVDWMGRVLRRDKRGFIDSEMPSILARLGLEPTDWVSITTNIERNFGNWVGSSAQTHEVASHIGQRWICRSPGCYTFYSD